MRVVADTNVLTSARLSPTGTPAQIVRLAFAGHLELLVSPLLLAELEEVLGRRKFRLDQLDNADYLAQLRKQTVVHDPPADTGVRTRDPDDDYLIALALFGRADAIVTGDRDLIDLADPPVPILTPRSLLNRIA